MTGRVSSALSKARFTHRSRIERFHVGSCCSRSRRARPARSSPSGSGSTVNGSSCPHHRAIDGWWPRRSTALATWRTAWRRTERAYPPCRGKSCQTSMPSSSAARYSSGRLMCPATRSRSRPASRASSTSRWSSAAVISPSSRRDGPSSAPLTNKRSPLTANRQPSIATSRSPVVTTRSSLGAPSASTVTAISVSGWSPSDHGHQIGGCSRSTFQPTSFIPRARVRSWRVTTRPSHDVVIRTVRAASLSSAARSTTFARASLTSRDRTRSASMRTGPVEVIRTGRHNPPGFHPGSIAVPSWNTPLRVRLARVSRCGQQVTSTARTCSRPRRARSVISYAWGKKYPSGSPR